MRHGHVRLVLFALAGAALAGCVGSEDAPVDRAQFEQPPCDVGLRDLAAHAGPGANQPFLVSAACDGAVSLDVLSARFGTSSSPTGSLVAYPETCQAAPSDTPREKQVTCVFPAPGSYFVRAYAAPDAESGERLSWSAEFQVHVLPSATTERPDELVVTLYDVPSRLGLGQVLAVRASVGGSPPAAAGPTAVATLVVGTTSPEISMLASEGLACAQQDADLPGEVQLDCVLRHTGEHFARVHVDAGQGLVPADAWSGAITVLVT